MGAGLALWAGALVGGVLLAWKGRATRDWLRQAAPFWDAVGLDWFYHALWRGAEHGLGVVRVAADVIEGSGALLWSLLILLLVLLLAGSV